MKANRFRNLIKQEDWWAVWFGGFLLALSVAGLGPIVPKIARWTSNPLASLPADLLMGYLGLWSGLGILTAIGVWFIEDRWPLPYVKGFTIVSMLGILSVLISRQIFMVQYGLGYALWAILIGLFISNTYEIPRWLKAGARSEMYIKTGLVLMGAEILFSEILQLGKPGLLVAWGVTPIVVIFMFLFGDKVLKISSKALTMTIACATSVCGVSAAIAAGAACRVKKEELTLAIGMTMIFTVIMMIVMPIICRMMGLDLLVAGAWIGGTIDSTGAVVAAGSQLGDVPGKVAAVVKMIQNALIGFIAFAIAVYWTTSVEVSRKGSAQPHILEIWNRFPKFILGFFAASLVFSFALMPVLGREEVHSILNGTKALRQWLFCLAFVSIGLESNFRVLTKHLSGGKPVWLYITGQSVNIILTLIVAWFAFGGTWFDVPVLGN